MLCTAKMSPSPEARTLLCGSQNLCKFVGRANPITNFEFVEEYVKNNKRNTYLILIFLPYPIPNLDYVRFRLSYTSPLQGGMGE
jgi:hypothetical protein